MPNYTVQFDTTVGSGDVAEGCAQSTTGVDLLRFRPDARPLIEVHEVELAALPDTALDRLLDLPISIYGGG